MIKDRVIEILKNNFEVDNITEDTLLREDLGTDSIGLLEIVMDFEDEFGIEIEDEKLDQIITVKDVVDYIESRK